MQAAIKQKKQRITIRSTAKMEGGYAKYIQFSLSRDSLHIIQNVISTEYI